MVSEIAEAVGLDANSLLNSEIEDLGKRLENVRQSLTIISDVAEEQCNLQVENQCKITETKDLLQSIKAVRILQTRIYQDSQFSHLQNTNIINLSLENDEQKLTAVRDNLLALGRAEGRIQQVRNKTLELSQTIRTETTVLEVLELWQEVFIETFQQYHKLSSRLVKNEDASAALRLWQDYLKNVQQFLQGAIPSDFYSLSDHQHLCQVHKNLLTTQQNILQPLDQKGQLAGGLVENSVMEQFNTLTSLHNETLNSIVERYTEVQNRINSWERYRTDQNRLHAWLKDIEGEKERMQLRYLHVRGIKRVVSQIDSLLGKMPYGEEQLADLIKQQNKILQFCDDALSTSIRMEHAALHQRISNIEASLLTWKQFLERIANLVQTHEERVSKLENTYKATEDFISGSSSQTTHLGLIARMEILQKEISKLQATENDLANLESSQRQLKECLSPSDMKAISQKLWVLHNHKKELEIELERLLQKIEEKQGQRSHFDSRQKKFMLWANDLEATIMKESDVDDPDADLEAVAMKLEASFISELTQKNSEYTWLISTGNELVSSCGEQYSDVTAKQILQTKTNEVKNTWEKLSTLGKTQIYQLTTRNDLLNQLEKKILEVRAWMTQMENNLGKPIIFEDCKMETYDRKVKEHEEDRKSIEAESAILTEITNLSDLLEMDDGIKQSTHKRYLILHHAIKSLQNRWSKLLSKSMARKRTIMFTWKLLHKLNELSQTKQGWIAEMETKLEELEQPTGHFGRQELQAVIFKLEMLLKEIEGESASFTILESTYSKMVTSGGLEPDNVKELTARSRIMITKWSNLLPKASLMLQSLQNEIALFKKFEVAQGDSVVALAGVDSKLTTLQHLSSEQTPRERLQHLNAIEANLNSQNATLQIADEMGLKIMKKGNKEETERTQTMIDEYQTLWKEIQERIIILRSEISAQIEQSLPQEVDEGVQVETLKFEQDTAVQVNTLPPQLQRMTSISAKDAYLVELASAIDECRANLTELKELLSKGMPLQGSPDLSLRSKEIVKLLARCQSNVEVVNHLNRVLIDECDSTEKEARSSVVAKLNAEYEELLGASKKMQQSIRELR